jgi:hypothetical protein
VVWKFSKAYDPWLLYERTHRAKPQKVNFPKELIQLANLGLDRAAMCLIVQNGFSGSLPQNTDIW